MTKDSVAEVARGLSAREREVLNRLGRTPRRATDFSGPSAANLRLPNAKRPALTDRRITYDHGRRTAWYYLTADGLIVKDHLNTPNAEKDTNDG